MSAVPINSSRGFYPVGEREHSLPKIYKKSEQVWNYLGKILGLTRQLLNIASKNCQLICLLGKDLKKITKVTTGLKLFSIASVPFNLVSLEKISEKIFNNFQKNHREAAILGSLSLTLTALDTVDTIAAVANSLLDLSGKTPIAALSALGLPLGFAMSGLGTVSRLIQIVKACQVQMRVKKARKNMVKAFLAHKLGDPKTQIEVTAPISEKIVRSLPGEVEAKLKEFRSQTTSSDNSSEKGAFTGQKILEGIRTLDKLQGMLRKKLIIEGAGVFANVLTITALFLFTFGTLGTLPFILIAGSFVTKIVFQMYQDAKGKHCFSISRVFNS